MDDLTALWQSLDLTGVTNDDIKGYLEDNYGPFTQNPPSDPKVIADVTKAKAVAAQNGNTKLSNTLDLILKYGDQALTILTKTGILQNKNLIGAGYSAINTDTGKPVTKDDVVDKAPAPSGRIFGLDFTDPKVLIILFLLLSILAYFLFFNGKKSKK